VPGQNHCVKQLSKYIHADEVFSPQTLVSWVFRVWVFMGVCVLSSSTKVQSLGGGPRSVGRPSCLAPNQHSLITGAAARREAQQMG